MGAYESLKAAQVHLAATLDEELQDTEVAAFTIGPGFVPTQTAASSLPRLAALMGKSEEEMLEVVKAHTLSVEAAGAGFAAAVAMAARYRGQEISSMQALADAGISIPVAGQMAGGRSLTPEQLKQALTLCCSVRTTVGRNAPFSSSSGSFAPSASKPLYRWMNGFECLNSWRGFCSIRIPPPWR